MEVTSNLRGFLYFADVILRYKRNAVRRNCAVRLINYTNIPHSQLIEQILMHNRVSRVEAVGFLRRYKRNAVRRKICRLIFGLTEAFPIHLMRAVNCNKRIIIYRAYKLHKLIILRHGKGNHYHFFVLP